MPRRASRLALLSGAGGRCFGGAINRQGGEFTEYEIELFEKWLELRGGINQRGYVRGL